ncbi:MAG: helix-turn-helix domain-containing protein [Halobacteriaceae archaeon]
MSVIADFTVPVGKFALKDTLPEVPTIKVEFERVVSHSQEWVMPFLWVYGDDLQTFDELTRRDPTVVSVTVTDEFSNARLYDIRWSADIKRIINSIFDRDGSLVEASGSADSWNLSVRFASRDQLTELQSHFDETDEPFEVQRIYEQTRPRQAEFNLSPKQRTVLVTGFENGYFDIPRRVTLEELAAELEISPSAISERLRRGIATLIESTLVIEQGGRPDT